MAAKNLFGSVCLAALLALVSGCSMQQTDTFMAPGQPPDGMLLPLLPWPPPPASLMATLKREPLLAEIGASEPENGAVGDFLENAMAEAGYDGRIRYIGLDADAYGRNYPDEFALVTGMEQIDEEARPLSEPARWAQEIQIEAKFSVRSFLRALFLAPKGHYRVLVFVVTHRQLQGASDASITPEMIKTFTEEGASSLPLSMRREVFGPRHQVIALVYEFEKTADNAEATQKKPSTWRATRHLDHTRLVALIPGQ